MENLVIEVGKFYKTRCGYKVQIYAIYPEKKSYRNIHGAYMFKGDYIHASWLPKGNFFMNEGYDLDIISEWTEPHPAENWEVDKKILVSDDGEEWKKAHFAKYLNGVILAWEDGKTSWTDNWSEIADRKIEWKFAKPAEENE